MFGIKVAATLLLVSDLVFQATPPGRPRPPVEYVRPVPKPAPLIELFVAPPPAPVSAEPSAPRDEESYVLVKGLDGRLLVLPSIMAELALTNGQEITLEQMYQLLDYNNRKLY